ncbi:MAG TPA: hypothetical protein VGH74_10675 [Planctomycetaceae bacterium]|jgi:hypothetical protein
MGHLILIGSESERKGSCQRAFKRNSTGEATVSFDRQMNFIILRSRVIAICATVGIGGDEARTAPSIRQYRI